MSLMKAMTLQDAAYAVFQRKVLQLAGIDLRCYKSEQMIRRLKTLMARCNAEGFPEFAKLLETDPKCLSQFLAFFTINVSEFFRDPERFEDLRKSVLPELLKHQKSLKVWSAGCSNGAEPYSVAMILAELTPLTRHSILATDIDAAVLRKANEADSYSGNDVRNVEPRLLNKYFSRRDDQYALQNVIRSMVDFRQHDLLKAPPSGGFDLILFRNVGIYFTEETKDHIGANLRGALSIGGILFVGSTESIRGAREAGLEAFRYSFYRRVS